MLTELDRGEGLHRAESRWPADVESLECHMARCVLARVHGRIVAQPTVRQGQRTLLATGLHEPRPLDHRAVPRAAAPGRQRHARMGDAAKRVPLRDRQGAVRQEDRTGADLREGAGRRVDHRSADALSRPQPRAARHRIHATPGRRGTDARAGDAGRGRVRHRPHDHTRP